MKRIVLLLTLAAMLFSFPELYSQSLRDRVKQAVFKEKSDTTSDEAVNNDEEEDSVGSASKNFTNKVMMNALGLTGNVAYEPVYSFDAHIQMEISEYTKNGKLDQQMLYDSYVHKEDADYAMEFSDKGSRSIIIFDSRNSAMLILSNSDGERTGFATAIDPESMAEMEEEYAKQEGENPDAVEEDLEYYRPKKTGKTKQILGYSCDEYMVEDEESEVHMWVSEKLGKEMRKEWMSNKQTFGGMFMYAYNINGMVMEYDLIEKGGKRSEMVMTQIDLNHSHQVSTEGYNIMSMKQPAEEEGEEEEE